LFYLLIALIVIFTDDFYKRQTDFSLLFGVSLSSICLFRLIHPLVSKRIAASKRPLNHVIFFISVGITALIWGTCFAHFMMLEDEHTTKLLMAICTAGLSAGGVVAFVPSLRLSVFYNFAMLAPAIVLMSIRQINLPLAIAILMFSVYMVLMANRGNREYWQALEKSTTSTAIRPATHFSSSRPAFSKPCSSAIPLPLLTNEKRNRRRAQIVYPGKVRRRAIPLGKISLVQPLLGNHLDVSVVEPVAVFVKVADLGKGGACRKRPAGGRQTVPAQVAV
jgi:hypothetical protein